MSRNLILLVLVLAGVATAYVLMNDLFRRPGIQIIAQTRPNRPSDVPRSDDVAVCPVTFALDGKYRLTSIRVLADADYRTNKYPTELWHLFSDSNSVPTKAFFYGQKITGMK